MDTSIFNSLKEATGPIYKEIASCIELAIQNGTFKYGQKLMTHRALAKELKVSPVTVSQAYQELERRGLIEASVGKGSFISYGKKLTDAINEDKSAKINLSIIKPIETPFLNETTGTIPRIFNRDLSSLFGYNSDTSTPEQLTIAKKWVARRGLDFSNHSLLFCSGAQHALLISILASTKPNDFVAVEEYCYPGILAALKNTGRTPVSVSLNDNGMCPSALQKVCAEQTISAVVVVASCHNPTGSVMPNEQRSELASVADSYDLTIIDDDIYGFLCFPEVKPLWTFNPSKTIYIDSLSKSIAPALRTAFIVIPVERHSEIVNLIRSTIWFCSPLLQELSCDLITSGKAEKIESWQKVEVVRRQKLAADLLPKGSFTAHPSSPVVWLSLPSQWTSSSFARELNKQGVHVTEDFYFCEQDPTGNSKIRISLVGTKYIEDLHQALNIICTTMQSEARLGDF
ncbi:PLP-dependent aminotransferase family protein [Alteromonas sp. 5E99-2]|uniref:aminotransferase-like domain-containing protein n=1 Tax=Alteromonas sp. 5E99-2 TaxID=2817683 RepID=UPI001A994211|nr:PLP-dependent aminotransferase family protein [Alteromonas sp. 5E99-2]MBO1254801.1 PLP-dependent aminotransferase family protein [Alteromonas sp. 5E99-2]